MLALRYGTGSHEAVRGKSGLPGTRKEGEVKTSEDPTGNAEEDINVGGRSIAREEDTCNVEACEGTVLIKEADADVDG